MFKNSRIRATSLKKAEPMPDSSHPFDQRKVLCELLKGLTDAQWEAETVCTGWDAKQLAAHLIVRERSLVAALGIVIPAFSGFHERGVAKVAAYPRQWLIDRLYAGPPWWTRVAQVHIAEDWIHTQDILRGGAATADPDNELDIDAGDHHPELAHALARACDRFAPLTLRKINGPFRVHLTDADTYTRTWLVRPGPKFALRADWANVAPDVTITGPIGELLLAFSGREHVANVAFTGNPQLISIIRAGLTGI